MQEGGNGSVAVSEPRAWRDHAQLVPVMLLAAALYFARATRYRQPAGADGAPDTSSAPPVVDMVMPVSMEQALTVCLTGTVSVQKTTSVQSEVAGRVTWVSSDFTNGGSFAVGEPRVRIDPAAFELAVAALPGASRPAGVNSTCSRPCRIGM